MIDPEELPAHRRELAAALRDLRRAAGLSGDRLARRVHMSQSKISKIETGRVLPTALDVERILGAIGVEQALREELTVLARLAAVEYRTWRSYRRTGMHHKR